LTAFSLPSACGTWRREWTLREEKHPLQVVDGIDEEFERHVDGSADEES
jgi:hypothetical protein